MNNVIIKSYKNGYLLNNFRILIYKNNKKIIDKTTIFGKIEFKEFKGVYSLVAIDSCNNSVITSFIIKDCSNNIRVDFKNCSEISLNFELIDANYKELKIPYGKIVLEERCI